MLRPDSLFPDTKSVVGAAVVLPTVPTGGTHKTTHDKHVVSAASAAALVATLFFAANQQQRQKKARCDDGSLAHKRQRGRNPGTNSVRCETAPQGGPGSESSIITLDVKKDKPGLLAQITEVMKGQHLDIRDAQIKTTEGGARHIYTVKDKSTGSALSDTKLEEVRLILEKLGEVACTAAAWPSYTQAHVAEHTTKETGIWVSYKSGVYDITDFVQNHPGGNEKILLAAGKPIDPFWRIYQQHEGRGNALTQLEKLRIGDLSDPPVEIKGDDPYDTDPARHPGLKFHNNKPCNAELPEALMMDAWVTPNPIFFIRHHHPVPVIDHKEFRLNIEGEGTKTVSLTVEDLHTRFLKREVVSTIQCGGNRRSELDKIQKTSGIPWGPGAISTARWGGVYLREVLMHCAGLSLEGIEYNGLRHVVCYGVDGMQASIPIEKALSPFGDVLLAYEMNGEPLPPEHGSPVRLIAPGIVGVRNVKWVGKIRTSKYEAEGVWQRGVAYKGFSPMKRSATEEECAKVQSIQEMPVTSSIVSPAKGAIVDGDDIEVKGIAWSGGGCGIVRVDVSADNGVTWVTAELAEGNEQHPSRSWAWTFWEASVPVSDEMRGKEITVLCRATDTSYNTQPERPEHIWNLRGLNCNCWHRVAVQHDDSD